jgi:hypothetical protein
MYVTGIGAAASIGDPEPDGTFVVTVRPWWSRTSIRRGEASLRPERLPSITREFRVSSREQLRREVRDWVLDHDLWTKIVAPRAEIAQLWRGIEWE